MQDLDLIQHITPCQPTVVSVSIGLDKLLWLRYDNVPPHELPTYRLHQYCCIPIWDLESETRLEAQLDGKRYLPTLFGRGSSSIITPGSDHWAVWDSPVSLSVFLLNQEFINQTAQEMGFGKNIELITKQETHDRHIYHLGQALKMELEAPPDLQTGILYQETLTSAFVMRLIKHHSVCRLPNSPILTDVNSPQKQLLLDYIHDNLHQSLRLVDLANLVNFSPYYLCRWFKQTEGLSIHQYVIQERIARSKTLLHHSEHSLAEIAILCGFNSHSHLSRQFKQIVGVTPSAFRRDRL
jgi:AraC family transcriptional regulator